MTHLRRLAALAFLLMTGASGAWAQLPSPISMTTGSFFSIDGLKLTVTGCSITSGSSAVGDCAHDELVATSGNRGGISFQLQNAAGTSSAALSNTTGRNQTNDLVMTYTITVQDNGSSKVVIGATETLVGENNIVAGSCSSGCAAQPPKATGSSSFSVAASPNPLLDTLAIATTNPQTAPVNSNTLNSNSFTLTETLSLNNGRDTNNGLKITQFVLHLTTTPEPASMTIFVLGLSGLVAARMRRRRPAAGTKFA